MAVTGLLLALSVWVRGIEVAAPPPPEDRPVDEPHIEEPMQLVAPGARHRREELEAFVSEAHRAAWRESAAVVFSLEGCPWLRPWLEGPEGQRCEQLLERLRAGTRDDALAALALVFELARSTRWRPSWGHAEHAERLGGLLQEWLRAWAERSADDPVLHQPAMAAALFYGSVMRKAWNAPTFGYNRSSLERARAFLAELVGAGSERARFGRALQARYPRAFAAFDDDEPAAVLRAFSEESALLFPTAEGDCEH